MEELNDPAWQKKHKTFEHVQPQHVFDSYNAYIESLDIRGHSHLAQLVGDRVDLGLCEKFPQLLLVIKALAGPLNLPTSPPVARKDPSWAEIVAEEPLTGDHWLEPIYYDSDDQIIGPESESRRAIPRTETTVETAHQDPPSSANPVFTTSTLVIPDLPHTLNQKEIIEEIKHQLLGYKTILPCRASQFPQGALISVLDEARQLAEITSSIRTFTDHQFAGHAFDMLRREISRKINYHVPTTLLAAMVYFKQLLVPHAYIKSLSQDYTKMLDQLYTLPIFETVAEPFRAQVSAWTSAGTLGPLLSVYQPSLQELVSDDFEICLPHFIDNKTVMNSGKYAVFMASLGQAPALVQLKMDYSLEIQISQLEQRNCHDLLSCLKPKLLSEWQRIGPVFLVQDARIVQFVFQCAALGLEFNRHGESMVAATLAVLWPEYPFKLRKCVPEFETSFKLLHLLLPIEELKNQWLATIDTIIRNHQVPTMDTHLLLLDFEAYNQHTLRDIAAQISNLDEVVPIKLPAV